MLGEGDPVTRASYLGVGVFANTVAEALLGLSLRSADEYTKVVRDAISVFDLVASGDPASAKTSFGLRPFRDYNQRQLLLRVLDVKSLNEAKNPLAEIVATLQAQSADPGALGEDKRKEAVRFFLDLANEALYWSRRPPEGIPQAVRELCQAKA